MAFGHRGLSCPLASKGSNFVCDQGEIESAAKPGGSGATAGSSTALLVDALAFSCMIPNEADSRLDVVTLSPAQTAREFTSLDIVASDLPLVKVWQAVRAIYRTGEPRQLARAPPWVRWTRLVARSRGFSPSSGLRAKRRYREMAWAPGR